jgi:3-oxoacyl-[acyl-carrier protein] reductase
VTDHLSLDGKVAVVTGAGGTMGRAVVRALHDDGCRVAMVDLHAASMDTLALEYGEAVFAVTCDIADAQAVRDAHERIVARFGAVDVLVNNAGILSNHKIEATDAAEWRKVMAANLDGVSMSFPAPLAIGRLFDEPMRRMFA